jgi:hypothetical protein
LVGAGLAAGSASLLVLDVFSKAAFEVAGIFFGVFEFPFGGGFGVFALVTAAGWLTALVAGLEVLAVSVSFVELGVGLLLRLFSEGFILRATFFHLALIAVLILVEPLLELVVSLPLMIFDLVLIKQRFDLAGSIGIV